MSGHKGKPRSVSKDTITLSGAIYNNNVSGKGYYIPIMFSPNSLSDSISASYNQTSIPGGSAPRITYTGTGARQLSLDLTIPLDYLPSSGDYNNTEEYLNAFRALVYPNYDNNGAVKSPNCTVSLPNIYFKGICQSCNINYKTDKYSSSGELSAEVGLSFLEVLAGNVSSANVAGRVTVMGGSGGGNSISSVTNSTYKNSNSTVYDVSTFDDGNIEYKTIFPAKTEALFIKEIGMIYAYKNDKIQLPTCSNFQSAALTAITYVYYIELKSTTSTYGIKNLAYTLGNYIKDNCLAANKNINRNGGSFDVGNLIGEGNSTVIYKVNPSNGLACLAGGTGKNYIGAIVTVPIFDIVKLYPDQGHTIPFVHLGV